MNQNISEEENKAIEQEKRQVSILYSGNIQAILSVLQEIREIGRPGILPVIFEVMLSTENDEILKSCTSLLSDLKDKEARGYLVDAIRDKKFEPVCQNLVTACWQNGLDYSDYIGVFTEILLTRNYLTSIEAFTVIENSLDQLSDTGKNKLILELDTRKKKVEAEKVLLIEELINTVKQY